jgi:putative nucleotidyltransferase with HDIG domain
MNNPEEELRAKNTLDGFLSKAQHLLPAPHILPQLLSLLNNPDTNSNKIVELISYDPPLTASVMRICNSAYYNRGTPIDSLQHAVAHIGLNETYRMVVAIAGSILLCQSAGKHKGTEAHQLWQHSATAALAAQILAQDTSQDEDVVFTAALLHDIGKILFAAEVQGLYDSHDDPVEKRSLVEVEKELFGLDHAELGGRLLEAWRFPTRLAAAVRFQHKPAEAMTFKRLSACVCLGDYLANALGRGYGRSDPPLQGRDEALGIMNISLDQLSDYEHEIQPRLRVLKDLYQFKV